QSREFLQAGVELLGAPGVAGTTEVLGVLCAALDAAGPENYRVGLGDASLYPSLLDAFGVASERQDVILTELAAGDFVGVDREVRALGLDEAEACLVLRLARARVGPGGLEG